MSYDTTVELISLALDASLMRQTAIANNIANVNTQDYQTQEVNFEQQLNLNSAVEFRFNNQTSLLNDTTESPFAAVKPFYETSPNTSSLDEQIALGVKNATQFRALIKGLNHKLAIMKLALQGNNQS